MIPVFFYGLFMDAELLRKQELSPRVLGRACARDYELRIGDKAALVPKPGAVSYGMLIALSDKDLAVLYSGEGVAGYEAIDVAVEMLDDGSTRLVACYNLPVAKLSKTFNAAYAQALSSTLQRLGFPQSYAESISQPKNSV